MDGQCAHPRGVHGGGREAGQVDIVSIIIVITVDIISIIIIVMDIIIISIIIVDIMSVVSAPHICQLQLHHHQWQNYKLSKYHCDRYGQCWVFAGVVTTVCRAIGLPCRFPIIIHISHTYYGLRHNFISHRHRHTQ